MVILAHRDLALLQRLLKTALVLVPKAHVRHDFGQFGKHLLNALFGRQDIGAAEIRGRRDLQQERVGGKAQQTDLVLILAVPQRLPAGRRDGDDVGIGAKRDVPRHAADAVETAVVVAVLERVGQVFKVRYLRLVDGLEHLLLGALAARGAGHQRHVGWRGPGAGGVLDLHQPRLAGGHGDGLHLDARLFGKARKDVRLEAVLEKAAIGADAQRRALRAEDRRRGQRGGAGSSDGADKAAARECVFHLILSLCYRASGPCLGQDAQHFI